MISSRYASDLIVFRKYDYGANVQCYYALKSYRRILKLLERDATDVDRFMEQMKADMEQGVKAKDAKISAEYSNC